jgi:hypothetical protein
MPLVRSIARGAVANGSRFSALVLGIVQSPAFQTNLPVDATSGAITARATFDNRGAN